MLDTNICENLLNNKYMRPNILVVQIDAMR